MIPTSSRKLPVGISSAPGLWGDVSNLHTHRVIQNDGQDWHSDPFDYQNPLGKHKEENNAAREPYSKQKISLEVIEITACRLIEVISEKKDNPDDDDCDPDRPWPIADNAHGVTCSVRYSVLEKKVA